MWAPGDGTPPSRHPGKSIHRPGRVSDDDVAGPAPSAAPSGHPSRRRARARRRRGPPPRQVPARPFGRQGHRPPGRARAYGRDVRRRRPPAPRTRCTAPGQPATGRARPRCRRGRRQWPGEQRDARRPRAFLGAHPGVVHRGVRRADAGPGGGMVRDPGGRARARGGSDGFRQDPRRLSVGPRPADVRASTREPGAALPGAVRVATEGPRRRHRAQPALPAGRDPAGGGTPRSPGAGGRGRHADRRHPAGRAAGLRHPAAGRADHHAGIPVPGAHLGGPSGPVGRPHGHPRRDPRRRRHQARRPSGPQPRATRRPAGGRTRPGAADRVVGNGPTCRERRRLPVRSAPGPRRRTDGHRRPAAGGQAGGGPGRRTGARPHRPDASRGSARRGAERLTARMNEVWAARHGAGAPDPGTLWAAQVTAQSGTAVGIDTRDASGILARAHHGSMSRAERTRTETELKSGHLPAVVATSSLELGIDMGAVDLVVQVGAPPSVASGLQRVGRAGHQVGAVSRGVIFPTHRGDLVPSAVTAGRMRVGAIEELRVPANPLDVLAQQVVAMVAMQDWTVEELSTVVRRAAPFTGLGEATLRAVLDMLAGRYPSEDFAELRPRIVWDRGTGVLSARPGAMRLAVTSGGTIPDRGLYGVFLAGADQGAPTDAPNRARGGRRVGELDEEMVYESRVGDTFTLGSSAWRIEQITPDRVLVTPAPGLPGRLPFWKGDSPGRPAELGRAVGQWVREIGGLSDQDARRRLLDEGLDAWAADNLMAYLSEQRQATGQVPDDTAVVVERFRDEIGDWRVVVHSPYGARVHAPWALVLGARLRDRHGLDAAVLHSDDGIVLRLPDMVSTDAVWDTAAGAWTRDDGPQIRLEDLLVEPDEVAEAVRAELGGSALFAARFREVREPGRDRQQLS